MSFATIKEKNLMLERAREREEERNLKEQFNFQAHFGFLLAIY